MNLSNYRNVVPETAPPRRHRSPVGVGTRSSWSVVEGSPPRGGRGLGTRGHWVGESANIPRSPERGEWFTQATPPVSLTEATAGIGRYLFFFEPFFGIFRASTRPATERDGT